MKGAPQRLSELNTWKEISAYLRVGVRTAQKYENDLGLPIHRLEGRDKPRVRAFSSELDAWKLQQGLAAKTSVSGQQTEAHPTTIPNENSVISAPRWGVPFFGVR